MTDSKTQEKLRIAMIMAAGFGTRMGQLAGHHQPALLCG